MTKINIATQLNKVFTAAVRARLAADERLVDPRKYVAAGRDAVAAEVARLLAVLRAAARGEPGTGGWNDLLELLAADGQLSGRARGRGARGVGRDRPPRLRRAGRASRCSPGSAAARSPSGVTYDLPLRYKTERHPTEKQRIARGGRGAWSGRARSPG